jgi:multiple sugar transport system substrate-binding protein
MPNLCYGKERQREERENMMRHRAPRLAAGMAVCALLVGVTSCASASNSSGAKTGTYLQLANDKPTWTNEFNAIGKVLASGSGTGWQANAYPSTTAFQAVVRTAATTSKAPALFTWWSGAQLAPLVAQHALANLTPEVKKWEAEDGLNPDVMKAYEVDGQYYGAPLYTSDWIMYYNKKDFAEHHLSVPTTWTELMSDASVLKSHGIAPFTYYDQDWAGFIWFEQLLVEENPAAYQELMSGKISYTSAPVVAAMEQWRTLANDGYFSTPEDIDTATPTDFLNGSQAMMLIGSWEESVLTHDGGVPGKTFGAFVVPPINPKVGWQAIFETGPVVVAAHNANESDAIKSLDTFMEPSVQAKWDKLQDFVSAESKVPVTDPTALSVKSEVSQESVTLHNRFWEATPPQIAVTVSTDLSQFILNPNLPLTPFLESLQKVASSYWSSTGS